MAVNTNYEINTNKVTSSAATSSQAESNQPIFTSKEDQISNAGTYTAYDVKKQELEKIEALYKKLSDTFMEWGITVEDAKNAGVIGQVAGKNEQNINEADLTRVEEAIKRAAKFVKSQKGELNLENLINAANKINVATIGNQYSWETVDAEISKMQKGERSGLFQHEDLNNFMERYYDINFDSMTLEQIQAKAKKLGINITENADLETAKNELKAGMLNKYFANHEFKSPAQQLDDFTKMLINTKNPEERKMFVEGVKTLYAENKEPAIQKLLASFTEIADRMDAADKLGQNAEEITNNTNPEQTKEIQTTISTNQSKQGAKETTERLNNSFEVISEIMNKIENGKELTDEEKKFLADRDIDVNDKEALTDLYNQMKSLNEGNNNGVASNKNYGDDTRTDLLSKIMGTYTRIDEKTGSNIRQEMLESLTKYIEEHPEVKITKENLTTIIENINNNSTNTVVVSDQEETNNNKATTGDSQDNNVSYEQKYEEEDVKIKKESVEAKRNEVAQNATLNSRIIITTNTTASDIYKNFGFRGIQQYCSARSGKELCKEVFRKSIETPITYLQEKAGRWLSGQSDKIQTQELLAYGTNLDLAKKYVSDSALLDASNDGHAPSTSAKEKLERLAAQVNKA